MLVSEILWIHTAYVLCPFLLLACQLLLLLPIQFYRILFILDLYHRLIALYTLIILALFADSLFSLTLCLLLNYLSLALSCRVFRN